jgi:hypothetical protein
MFRLTFFLNHLMKFFVILVYINKFISKFFLACIFISHSEFIFKNEGFSAPTDFFTLIVLIT